MSDKVVQFAPRAANGPTVEGDGVVAELKTYDTGRIEVPQADGSVKPIIFNMDVADWWMALTERMFVTMPEGPYGRAFVTYSTLVTAATELHTNRKRSMEIELNRQQFGQLLEAIPFQLLETGYRNCQLSVAEFIETHHDGSTSVSELPVGLPSAMFIYQVEGERFRLHYIEQ